MKQSCISYGQCWFRNVVQSSSKWHHLMGANVALRRPLLCVSIVSSHEYLDSGLSCEVSSMPSIHGNLRKG